MTTSPKKLLDQVRDAIRLKHYSLRTEGAYVDWVRRYVLFHNKRHPREMGAPEIEAFLTHLAVEGHVSASTQNQALSALLFLYREVLRQPLAEPLNPLRARRPQRLPTRWTCVRDGMGRRWQRARACGGALRRPCAAAGGSRVVAGVGVVGVELQGAE